MDHNSNVLKLLKRIDAQENYLVSLLRDPLTPLEPAACRDDRSMDYIKQLELLKAQYAEACEKVVKLQLQEDRSKLEAINTLLSDNTRES